MARNNILLHRLPAPKQLQLPNGCVFFPKYQRVGRHALIPTHVRIARIYTRKMGSRPQRIRRIGPRNRQRRKQAGARLDMSASRGLGRKAVASKPGKMLINDVIDYIPRAYKN